MESGSRIYTSPTFNTHASTDIANIADRVVHELRTHNELEYDDVFAESDDDSPPENGYNREVNTHNHPNEETNISSKIPHATGSQNHQNEEINLLSKISHTTVSENYQNKEKNIHSKISLAAVGYGNHQNEEINMSNKIPHAVGSGYHQKEETAMSSKIPHTTESGNHQNKPENDEFEFPVVRSPVSTDEVILISEDHVSLRYPVFDTSLLSELDLNKPSNRNKNSVDSLESVSTTAARTRPSLRKLLSEERDPPSPSTSSSSVDDLDGATPGTYCVWKPNHTPNHTPPPRGKHKKSNSISIGNTSKRWKVRDLLKRSYSDDNYTVKESSVMVFIPPVSPKQKMSDEKVNKVEKSGKVAKNGSIPPSPSNNKMADRNIPASSNKTERNIPAYKAKIGNIRLPPYLPYRQDQVAAAFANFDGSSNNNMYRY